VLVVHRRALRLSLRAAAGHSTVPAVKRAPYDVIMIGAGAAGLAAAGELLRAGRSVLLLEARDRLGGRIWTRKEAGLPAPIELGAEFIHGPAHVTRELLAQVGTTAIESSDVHCTLAAGKLIPRSHFFPKIQHAMRAGVVLAKRDMSFDAFLNRHMGATLSLAERRFARMMAEGFDAADPARASARAIAAEWIGDTVGNVPTARPRDGYEALLRALAAPLESPHAQLQLQATARSVRWSRGTVEVDGVCLGRPFRARAARCIVCLPLGVLQSPARSSGGVSFTPALTAKRAALGGLASGPVVKVLLRFATAFWDSLHGGRYRDASFFHAARGEFVTFWTPAPLSAPMLVAWAGGPRARRIARGCSPEQIARKALVSLQSMFGRAVDVASQLQGFYYQDWQRDPFACGAYSYALVGGEDARRVLGLSLDNTLFFAGEATDTAGEGGTVSGALTSGLRAAREVLAD
jgi:monoamine oxidase